MFKSLLSALKPSPTQGYVIEFSAELARRAGAELHGCVVFDIDQIAPREPVPAGGGAYKKALDEERLAAARTEAQTAVEAVLAAGVSVGLPCSAELVEGNVVDVLSRRVHEHDLLVVGCAADNRDGDESLLHRILKASARPVLVFPKRAIEGQTVVVGYDASRQSARALSALVASRFAVGRPIRVVSCDVDLGKAAAAADLACEYLRRHGLEATAHAESLGDPAAILTDWAVQSRASLLVVGAFGHGTLREWLFGSTTRTLLRSLPAPLLLDH